MLNPTTSSLTGFVDATPGGGDYRLEGVRLDIPDEASAVFCGTLIGPEGSKVWARAWLSNEVDGTLAEKATGAMMCGDEVILTVTLSGDHVPELACMRIESAPFETRHVVSLRLDV